MNLRERLQKCHDDKVSKGETLAYDSLEFNVTWTELLEMAKQVYPEVYNPVGNLVTTEENNEVENNEEKQL